MDAPSATGFRKIVLERLAIEFGPPFRSGDSCQWTSPRPGSPGKENGKSGGSGGVDFKLTTFMDGEPACADGWVFIAASGPPDRFVIRTATDLDALIARCHAAASSAYISGMIPAQPPSPPAIKPAIPPAIPAIKPASPPALDPPHHPARAHP